MNWNRTRTDDIRIFEELLAHPEVKYSPWLTELFREQIAIREQLAEDDAEMTELFARPTSLH